MNYYRVTLTHDDLEGPLVLDLAASTPERAATRAKATATHMYRHAELLHSATEVETITAEDFLAANA